MSNAFDIIPVPAEAEDLNIDGGGFEQKFYCDNGDYPAVCIKMEKVAGKEGKPDRVQFQFALTAGAEKGIKASQSFPLSPDWRPALARFVAGYGVTPQDGVLRLRDAYSNIVGVPVNLTVKQRKYQDKTFMDAVRVAPLQKVGDDGITL